MEMKGQKGEEAGANPTHNGKHDEEAHMTEVGDADGRGKLGLIPGLEEGRFGVFWEISFRG
jgi:hypothetical protein